MVDFKPGHGKTETLQRSVVERLVSRVANLFEPPLTPEEMRRLRGKR